MKCPNCHKSSNVFKSIFVKRNDSKSKYCIFCNAEVNLKYNWTKIFILAATLAISLIFIQLLLKSNGQQNINGGLAGFVVALIMAIVMRQPPFTVVELVVNIKKKNKKRRN
jgi:K+ transporter